MNQTPLEHSLMPTEELLVAKPNISKEVHRNSKNEFNKQVASGVCVYELTTPTFKQIKQLVELK